MIGKYKSEFDDCRIELNNIKSWIDKNKIHSNVRFLVSYSVIKTCGTIEMILKQMLFDLLISGGANEEAKRHFSKYTIDASFNPSSGQIERILNDIDPNKKIAFESALKGKPEKIDLKSLVALRNSFAHGSSITASIDTIIKYFESGVWVMEQLYTILFVP